jgi:hypothetical protein
MARGPFRAETLRISMLRNEALLPLLCPHCDYEGAYLQVTSRTVLTASCARCSHSWATDISALSEDVRREAQVIVLRRDHLYHP